MINREAGGVLAGKRGPLRRRRGRFMRLLTPLVVTSWFAVSVDSVHGWGDEGHKIVCAIADRLLADTQRAEVRRLVHLYRPGNGTPYRFFTTACAFADLARIRSREFSETHAEALKIWARFGKFDNWHFLNLSRQARKATAADCHDDCVLKGIDEHRARLANKWLKDWERAEALILLSHWVADLHQPLHVSYGDDLGGSEINKIRGDYYSSPNLHAVWDSGIIKKARGRDDWLTYSKTLASIPASDRATWKQSTPLDWANESYNITIEADTDYCELSAGTCRAEGRTRTLTRSYQTRFQPVVETRLRQAGVRLAKLIAEALQ